MSRLFDVSNVDGEGNIIQPDSPRGILGRVSTLVADFHQNWVMTRRGGKNSSSNPLREIPSFTSTHRSTLAEQDT